MSNLFLNSIVRIERFMHLSILSKYLFGAPPHAIVQYSIYGFRNELQMLLWESCCRELLRFFRIPIPLLNLLLICSICLSQLNRLSIYTPRYLAVFFGSSIWFSIYIFIVSSALWLLPTLKTMRFDFLTLISNFFCL